MFVVVAGGMGTLPGPIIGAIIFVIVDRLIAGYAGHGLLILGLASIIIMFVMPRGVMGIVNDLRHLSPEEAAHGPHAPAALAASAAGRVRTAGGRRCSTASPAWSPPSSFPGIRCPCCARKIHPGSVLVEGYQAARKAARCGQARRHPALQHPVDRGAGPAVARQPRISGLHVDENWHEYGNLRYDLRIDVNLAKACVAAATKPASSRKLVDYDGFPIDTGTIVANAFLNPEKEIPVLVAANNLYHDFDTTRRLAEIAVEQAIAQGKRSRWWR